MAPRRRILALATATAAVAGTGLFAVAAGAASPNENFNELVSCSGTVTAAVPNIRLDALTQKFILAPGQTKTGTLTLPTVNSALPGVTLTTYHLVWGAQGLTGGTSVGDFFGLVGSANSSAVLGQQTATATNETWVSSSDTATTSYTFIDHSPKTSARVTLAIYPAAATQTVTKVYAGTLCPAGYTKVNGVQVNPLPTSTVDPTPVVTPSP